MVHPDYRTTLAAFKIQHHIMQHVAPREDIDAVFSEAVCHHLIAQTFAAHARHHETAIEVGLMPAHAQEHEDFPDDRISTLIFFKELREKWQVTYIPREYNDALAFIVQEMKPQREFREADPAMQGNVYTDCRTEFFDFAQVARAHVFKTGADFPETVLSFEKRAAEGAIKVMQFVVNLGDPLAGQAVSHLRKEGYFLGGFLPRWFDTDGLLMQNVLDIPAIESIKLYSQKAREILQLIRKDVQENPACAAVAGKWRGGLPS
jgi:hypothetical protein